MLFRSQTHCRQKIRHLCQACGGQEASAVAKICQAQDPSQKVDQAPSQDLGQAQSAQGQTPSDMKLTVAAIGLKVPDWAQIAWDDYAKRFPPDIKFQLKAIKAEPRGSKSPGVLMAAEAERIRAAWGRDSHRVVLDERGDRLRTLDLAERLKTWQSLGQEVVLVIGGPDGLDEELRSEAHERIRLSDLTLPHAFVRVLLVEQLYRAWSILAHHPYHRE